MDLNEHYKIGSVYRAKINGRVLAVKKTKDDVTEELKILQKVSHANLVKLMGMSSGFDREGNRFLVYEFAENGVKGCIRPLNLPQALQVSSLGVKGYM